MSQINPVHVPTAHLRLFKKLITFEYYRHLLLHGWVIAIDHYRLLPLNVDYCRLLPSYATPRLVFLVTFFILRADEALISSITVLPSGSTVSYSLLGCLSCNPVSVVHQCFICGLGGSASRSRGPILTKFGTMRPITILKVLPKFQAYVFPTTHTRTRTSFFIYGMLHCLHILMTVKNLPPVWWCEPNVISTIVHLAAAVSASRAVVCSSCRRHRATVTVSEPWKLKCCSDSDGVRRCSRWMQQSHVFAATAEACL